MGNMFQPNIAKSVFCTPDEKNLRDDLRERTSATAHEVSELIAKTAGTFVSYFVEKGFTVGGVIYACKELEESFMDTVEEIAEDLPIKRPE